MYRDDRHSEEKTNDEADRLVDDDDDREDGQISDIDFFMMKTFWF